MPASLGRAVCLALLCASLTCAASEDDTFEEHHAHEHGKATLDVAIEGTQLQLRFDTPAMNLVGFEHPPHSPEDRAAAARAEQLLRAPDKSFVPSSAARCQVVKIEVSPPNWQESHEHADFEASYEFRCEEPAQLQQIDVRLLGAIDPDVKIVAQVASTNGQYSVELTQAKPKLQLRAAR